MIVKRTLKNLRLFRSFALQILSKKYISQTFVRKYRMNEMNDCKLLNRFYIDTRYPVHWPTHYTKEEALKAQKATKHIRDVIKNAIGSHIPSLS